MNRRRLTTLATNLPPLALLALGACALLAGITLAVALVAGPFAGVAAALVLTGVGLVLAALLQADHELDRRELARQRRGRWSR